MMRSNRPARQDFPLVSNEEVVWSGRPPLRAALTGLFRLSWGATFVLSCVLIVAIVVVAAGKGTEPLTGPDFLQAVSVMLLLWMAVSLLRSRRMRYAITTERVWIAAGLLWQSERTADLDKVVSVAVRRGPLQRLLGLASIDLNLTGTTVMAPPSFPASPFTLYDVPSQQGAQRLLMDTWLPRDNAGRRARD